MPLSPVLYTETIKNAGENGFKSEVFGKRNVFSRSGRVKTEICLNADENHIWLRVGNNTAISENLEKCIHFPVKTCSCVHSLRVWL